MVLYKILFSNQFDIFRFVYSVAGRTYLVEHGSRIVGTGLGT